MTNNHAVVFHSPRDAKVPAPRVADAAGVLFRYVDSEGVWYFLTQRAAWLSHGGTWAYPAGSVDRGEAPLMTAMRELEEETGLKAHKMVEPQIVATIENRDSRRLFTTFVVTVSEDFDPGTCLSRETSDAAWVREDAVGEFPLHPGLELIWDAVSELAF